MKIKKLHIYLFKDNIEIVQKNGEIDEYIKNLRLGCPTRLYWG